MTRLPHSRKSPQLRTFPSRFAEQMPVDTAIAFARHHVVQARRSRSFCSKTSDTLEALLIFILAVARNDLTWEITMYPETQEVVSTECRFIRIREVLKICGLSRASLYKSIKMKEVPASVQLSSRSVGWLYDEVIAWVNARVKRRDSKQ
jgi:predicted DNA-binding transcriptional regulator AlpA